jgi:hypothetical protein
MEPIMLLILSISLAGIVVLIGLSQFKIEHNTTNNFSGSNPDFSSFMIKIKGNSLKIKR